MLILAGAGSGKTKTLTHRVANLIDRGMDARRILAVTFTNKAAAEMRSRTTKLLETMTAARQEQPLLSQNWQGLQLPFMGTFHGIALKILRFDGEAIGLASNFIIYDADDRRLLIKNVMKGLGMEVSRGGLRDIEGDISNAKNHNIDASEFLAQASTNYEQDVAQVYRGYEQERIKNGALDFDDLLLYWLRLMEQPEVREKYRQRFEHILIDEYQDTNKIQYQIVKLLVNEQRNICVVGDDWQSIYAWRGADYQNILNFERDFKGATVIKLEQNYRSTKSILEAANKVIKENANRTDKTIWTDNESSIPIKVRRFCNAFDEARFVAQTIGVAVDGGGARYDEFAILYRMNSQSLPFEKVFVQNQIPYKIIGGQRFYDRTEVKDVVAYLNLLIAPNDSVSLRRAINVPTRGIGPKSVEKYLAGEKVGGKAGVGLEEFQKLLADLREKTKLARPREIVEELVERLQYLEYLATRKDERADARVENVKEFIREAGEYESLDDFLGSLALFSSGDETVSNEAVTLMTVHSAKGLEWDEVFVAGLNDGILPTKRALDQEGGEAIEEERRLLYVAMTRARKKLYVTSYEQSMGWGGSSKMHDESRFLKPLLCNEIDSSLDGGEVQACYDGVDDVYEDVF
ncbi:UvrD-helicase domain-containing protein [Candidatus Saccharibacteria bacterium]|nr:UvrD-helicase domain-containing protein [Candidatus Saccharibacteria bacterium]